MASIKLEKVEKWFDEQVLKEVNLEIQDGEFIVFVGPSGCGKSTLLRVISGLEDASSGKVFINGEDVTAKPPYERKLSMVFQSYALYPHMSIRENLGFALKTAGMPKREIQAKVDHAAKILKLEDYLERKPKELSGGQRQRVAIGRAIVREPQGFLFDEPLSNLDAALRIEMRLEIAKLHYNLKSTMIYVTHDQVEAMTLADKIVVLQDGIIEQIGTPKQLYQEPKNIFVAQFIGSPKMNLLTGKIKDQHFYLSNAINSKPILIEKTFPMSTLSNHPPTLLGIRAEHIEISSPESGDCQGVVEVSEYLGADTYFYIQISDQQTLIVRQSGSLERSVGEKVGLVFQKKQIHLFDDQGHRI